MSFLLGIMLLSLLLGNMLLLPGEMLLSLLLGIMLLFLSLGNMFFSLLLGDPVEFAGTALNTHNRYRMYHHDPPLKWSDKLSSQANKIAYEMVKQLSKQSSKRFEITEEESVGENVERFLGVKFGCDSTAAMKSTDNWYKVYNRIVN